MKLATAFDSSHDILADFYERTHGVVITNSVMSSLKFEIAELTIKLFL